MNNIVNTFSELFNQSPLLFYATLVGLMFCVRATIKIVRLVIRIVFSFIRRGLRLALLALACGVLPMSDSGSAAALPPSGVTASPVSTAAPNVKTADFQYWLSVIKDKLNGR